MAELLTLGTLAVAGLVVFGLLAALVALVCWLIFLPFRILGFVFKLVAFLLALPFMILFAIFGIGMFGVGALFLFFPLLPFVALVGLVFWLVRRNRAPARPAMS